MQNFMKTIISAVQTWTKGEIKDSTADWNENDSGADSYVKNRTHWEEMKLITLLPEITVVIEEDGEGYVELSSNITQLTIGQEYHITLNGVEYACVAREWNEDDSVTSLIGNGTIYGDGNEGNGEPFSCDSYEVGSIYLNAAVGEYTISISTSETVAHKLDSKYLPTNLATTDDVQGAVDVANAAQNTADAKMDKTNPVGTGSFSMNRKPDTIVGDYSHAEGNGTTASEYASHAEGNGTTASGSASHAEGYWTVASGDHSHAEGEGSNASGYYSHAEGWRTTASGTGSHAEGDWTVASGACQHVQGEYNIIDTPVSDTNPKGKYAHIVGNGIANDTRSNAHTLDWDGNAWFQGAVKIGGTGQDDEAAKEVATKEYVDNAEFVSYNPQTLTDEQKAQVRANIDRYVWHTFSDSYGTYTYTLDPTKNFNYELAQTVANTSNNGSISALEDIVSWLSLLARCSYKTPGASNEVIENVAKNFDAIKNSGAGMSLSFYYQHTGHNGLGASVDVGLHPGDGYVVVTIYNGYADFHASFSYNSETNTTTEKYLNRRFADKTLSKEGYYADAKAVGDAISQISSQNAALTTAQIEALDGMFKVCAFTKADVSTEYTAFKNAFGITDSGEDSGGEEEPDEPVAPTVTLTSISAAYSGGDVAVGTAVTTLTGIVVTAHYSDGSTATVTGYTLDGTITEGENTVTVIYGGKMTEFVVVGVAESGGEVVMLKNISFDGTSYLDTEVIPESVNYHYVLGVQTPSKEIVKEKYFGGISARNHTNPANSTYWDIYWRVNTGTNNYNADVPSINIVQHCMGLDANATTGFDKGDGASSQPYDNPLYYNFDNGSQSVWIDEDCTEAPVTGHFASITGTVYFTNQANYTDDEHPIDSIWLGKVHVTGGTMTSLATEANTYAGAKFYCFKVYDTDENLIADMHPAKQGNTVGMWCNVRNKFYPATGTTNYEEVSA